MKNLKKVIALIAVLALTLSTVALGATYSDVVEDSAYSVAVESLSKLGIVTGYEDGTYGPEKAVTRAEMAALIARIQGYEETASAQTATVFTDVPADFWGSGYVAAASNMGIVNGYGDGTFGPDDAVKYEQAVTMIMRTLGYEPFAAANGGYPTGYLAAAQRYGLTKNVSNAVSGTDANRGTIAQLLYNGIDTPIMAQSKWGTNGDIEYTIYDGTSGKAYKTLMSENLNVVKVKGIVTANVATALTGTQPSINTEDDETVTIKLTSVYDTTDKNFYSDYADKVKKSSMTFKVADTDIAEALGYSVVAYVVEDEIEDNKYNVVSYAKDSATNKVAEFTLDQYAGLNDEKDAIEYYKNATDSKTSELKFDNSVNVVYNFVGAKTVTGVFDVAPVVVDTKYSGKVTLIDNNNTNGYDVAVVEVSESRVVKKVTEEMITFKKGAGVELDPEATDVIMSITKDGKAISPAELTEWDVITVVANNSDLAEASYIKGEVIGSTVVGKVASTKKSDTSNGGKAYKIESAYYDVAIGAYEAAGIEIGEGGTFYIDKYGKIVAFNEDATLVGGSAGKYAYVIEADTDKGFGEIYGQARLLTANGIDIYNFADEFEYINGAAAAVEVEIVEEGATGNQWNAGDVATKLVGKMIKYNVNSAGEIDEIAVAAGSGADVEEVEFKLVDSDTAEWDADNESLSGIVDDDATVFLLAPGKDLKTNSIVGTIADLKDGESYTYKKFLDEKGDDANIILITSGFGVVGKSTNVAILTDISLTTNEEGDDVFVLSYYQDGAIVNEKETSSKVYDDFKDSGLTIGDIVKVDLTADVITGLAFEVNFGEDIRNSETGKLVSATAFAETTSGKETKAFGFVKSYNDNSSSVTIESGTSVRVNKADYVYVIDAKGQNVKVKVGSENNITDSSDEDRNLAGAEKALADYVYYRKYDGGIVDVVIIKNVIDFKTSEIEDYID